LGAFVGCWSLLGSTIPVSLALLGQEAPNILGDSKVVGVGGKDLVTVLVVALAEDEPVVSVTLAAESMSA
jgi:hypothetical protein